LDFIAAKHETAHGLQREQKGGGTGRAGHGADVCPIENQRRACRRGGAKDNPLTLARMDGYSGVVIEAQDSPDLACHDLHPGSPFPESVSELAASACVPVSRTVAVMTGLAAAMSKPYRYLC
jgi:hypothetical protein